MARKINRAIDSIKDIVSLIDQLGGSVGSLEERVRSLNSQFAVASQLTGGNRNPNIATPLPPGTISQGLQLGGTNAAIPPPTPFSTAAHHSGLASMPSPFQAPLPYTGAAQGTAPGQNFGNTFANLDQSLRSINATLQNVAQALNNFSRQPAPQPMPPPSGAQGGELKDLIKDLRSSLGAIGALGVAGYNMYMQPNMEMRRANLTAEARAAIAQGSIVGTYQRRTLDSLDLTDPENLLRYKGDMLFPGTRFLGASGWDRAQAAAASETNRRVELMRLESQNRAFTSTMGVLGGVGMMVGGGLLAATGGGLPLGLGMMVGGAGALSGGISGLSGAYNSPYDQMQNGGLVGLLGNLFYGGSDAARQRRENMAAMRNEIAQNQLQSAQAMQEAEMAERQIELKGMTQAQRAMEARKQGSILVGRYSRGGYEEIGSREIGIMGRIDANFVRSREAITPGIAARLNPMDAGKKHLADLEAAQASDQALLDAYHFKAENSGDAWYTKYLGIGEDSPARKAAMEGAKEVGKRFIDRRREIQFLRSRIDERQEKADMSVAHSEADSIIGSGGKNWEYWASIIDRFETRGTMAQRYSAVNEGGPGGMRSTGASGRYQIMPMWAGKFERVTGVPYSNMAAHPEAQDQYFREVLLPEHLRNAKVYRGMNPSLSEDQAFAIDQFGYGNVTKYLRGERDPRVAPQIEGVLSAVGGRGATNYNTAPFSPADAASGYYSERTARILNEMPRTSGMAGQRFGMTEPEFMGYRNQMLNVVRPGGEGANIAGTSALLSYQYGGLGSFDSLLGNLGGLNRVAGGDNNIGRLTEIFSNAVAIGFDRSRNAQQFVQSVTDLSGRLGTTNTGMVSELLASTSRFGSANGIADERSLAMARSGIEGAEQATSGTSGLMGAVKATALLGTGTRLGQGLDFMMKRGIVGAYSMLDSLKGVGSLDQISDRDLQGVINSTPGRSFEEKLANFRRRAGMFLHNVQQAQDVNYMTTTGRGASQDLTRAVKAGDQGSIRQWVDQYAGAMSDAMGVDLSTGRAMAVAKLRSEHPGAVQSMGPDSLEAIVSQSNRHAIPSAEVMGAQAKDALGAAVMANYLSPVTRDELKKVLARGNKLQVTGMNAEGHQETFTLDDKMYGRSDLPAWQRKAIEETRAGLNRYNLAVATGAQDILTRPDQAGVRITNLGELSKEMLTAMKDLGLLSPKTAGNDRASRGP